MEYPAQLEKLVVCWTSFGDKGALSLEPGCDLFINLVVVVINQD